MRRLLSSSSRRRRPARRVARPLEALESRRLLEATPIFVGNPSFELNAAAEDGSSNIAIAWTNAGSPASVFNPFGETYTGALDDSPSAGVLPAPADQKQVLTVDPFATANTVEQTMTNALAKSGTRYSLTVSIGNRSDVEMQSYEVALFAGSELIGGTSGDAELVAPNGGFADVNVFSPGFAATSPAVGQPLRIVFTNSGTKGGGDLFTPVDFDNVRLTEEPVPPPDTTPPTVGIEPPQPVSGTAFTDFEVTYADNVAVDVETINDADLRVTTGPVGAGQTQLAVTLRGVDELSDGSAVATWRVAAPGGTWDAADNGSYTVTSVASAVFDTSGNRSAPTTTGFAFVGDDPDVTPPSVTLNAAAPPAVGIATYDFTVTYNDDEAVALQTIGSGDIQVTGPNGYSQTATLVSVNLSGDAPQLAATYRVTGPGGTWDTPDIGTYNLAMLASAVADTSDNAVVAGAFGSFQFGTGVGPVASYPQGQAQPAAGATAYQFNVTFTDATVVSAASIGADDVLVTGPRGFSAGATLVSTGLVDGTAVTARYSVAAPGGTFGPEDDGTYVVSVAPGAVTDTNANAAVAGGFGQFVVALAPPVVGGLDPGFGNGSGQVTFNPPGPPLKVTDVITLDDGSTVSAAFTVASLGGADVTLFKTTPAGNLDTTFGGNGNGLVVLDVGADDRATSVVRTDDGKYIVTGTTSTYSGTGVETDADFFVARFNANGTLDAATYGQGSGFAVADFGSASFDRANDAVLLPGGRVLVFGSSTVQDPDGDFALARFTADGDYDLTFGNGAGRVLTDLGGADVANAVAIGADGRVVAAGSTASGNTGSFAVVRYEVDGSINTAFGPNGTGINLIDFRPGLDEAQSIVIGDSGRMTAGGIATSGNPDDPDFDADFAVAGLDANGNLDASFGSGGKALTDFGPGLASINKLIFQPGGKVLASGQVVTSLDEVGGATVRVAVARFNADGSLDANFAEGGKFIAAFAPVTVTPTSTPVARFDANGFGDLAPAADVPVTELEQKFQQFLNESQGLVTLAKGGGILLLFTQGDNVRIAKLIGDGGEAPSLFVALIPNIDEIDVTSSTFVVRYVDDLAVNTAILGTGDIRVTGPNGFDQLAEFVGILETGDGPERTVRYRVKPANGAATFTNADEGTYALLLEANRVADVNGNFLAGGAIPDATFTVNVPENLANLRTDSPLTGKFPAAVVGGAKAKGGASVLVSNSGVLDAKTSISVAIFASADNTLDELVDTQVAVFNGVKVAIKPGKSKALKLKFTTFPATLPDGDYFLIASVDSAGVVPELKQSDNNATTATPINISAPFVDLSGTTGGIKGTPTPGKKITATANVRNDGNVPVKQSVAVELLASLDQQEGADTELASVTAKLNVNPASTKPAKLAFTIPAGLAPGTYFLLAVLDSSSLLAEKNETNNLVVIGQFTV